MSDMTQDSVPESIAPSVAPTVTTVIPMVNTVYYQTPIFHLTIEGSNYDIPLQIYTQQSPHIIKS